MLQSIVESSVMNKKDKGVTRHVEGLQKRDKYLPFRVTSSINGIPQHKVSQL